MGRTKDEFWQYVDTSNENKCNFCGQRISGVSRIKFHLAQITGEGISICDKVPDDVKRAAISALNSCDKRLKQSRSIRIDLVENDIGSSLSRDSARGKQMTGRKRDKFWQYVDTSNGKKCNFCGHRISGASRIKFHLAQVPGEGILICDKVPDDVKSVAALALNSCNKRVKQSRSTPTDLEENVIGSSLPRGSTRGEIEVDLLHTTDLVGEEFQSYLDEIWEWLMEDEVSIMGVWGMGGVGKTTLLKHIHNKLLNHNHHVIWVTVSQNYSIRRLQKVIAKSIDENIWDEDDDEMKTAAMLFHAFKKINKCVVILDDVWYDISLEDVGIPFIDSGIKIIVASRLLDVCKSIGCEQNVVKMECLEDDEAFTLFSKSLGDDVTPLEDIMDEDDATLPKDIKDIAYELTEECRGLPLAIVTMARSMRGKADIREWRDALSKLRRPEKDHNDIKRCVFPVLKSSFDHLNDRTTQDCFLCLPLYIEDDMGREDWIRIFVDEGLINGRQSFEAQLDEGYSILKKLISNNLLNGDVHGNVLWLHNMVRAMAVNIGRESHGYKTELPDEREWEEDFHKISLICNKRTEIPSSISPKCPRLTILRMRRLPFLEVIPDNFFINMPSLKILDLSYNEGIAALPESISNLECLTVLLLCWCESLCHIPSLAKVRQLRRLDLSYTAITQVPLGFENLTNLRWLHFKGTAVMKAQDLERLQMLESISAEFVDEDEFIASIQIKCMDISLNIDSDKTVVIDGVENSKLPLPSEIDVLKILHCNQWRSLCDVLSIQQSNNKLHISRCDVNYCNELEYLFCSSDDCVLCSSLQGLNELYLDGLSNLSMLWKENEVTSSFLPFSYLTKLAIGACNDMKKLLTPGMSTQLRNLEEIDVSWCDSMEEIFSTEKSSFSDELLYEVEMDDNNVEAINLPNLKSVSLGYLPQLNSVCRGVIKCASLKYFYIGNCPKLKCGPQTQPPFEIQVKDSMG